MHGEPKDNDFGWRRRRIARGDVPLPGLQGYVVKSQRPQKKKLHLVVHEFEPGFGPYSEKPGHSWDADLAFADVNPTDYVAQVIPGGRAPNYIRNNADCLRILRACIKKRRFLLFHF
jgi:deglycase